ncbi:MAG: hypothetical protein JST70_13045 [Bacteroidetes bacterium]|nr:hypothetical protein [Bacteroidota bacterium]
MRLIVACLFFLCWFNEDAIAKIFVFQAKYIQPNKTAKIDTAYKKITVIIDRNKFNVVRSISKSYFTDSTVNGRNVQIERFRSVSRKEYIGQYIVRYPNAILRRLIEDDSPGAMNGAQRTITDTIYSLNGTARFVDVNLNYFFIRADYFYSNKEDYYSIDKNKRKVFVFDLNRIEHLYTHEEPYKGFQLVDQKYMLPLYTEIDYIKNGNKLIISCVEIK